MMTKNGIEMNLKKSKYKFIYGRYVFYFSSEFYLKKFKQGYQNFICYENEKIKMKYQVDIDLNFYLLVSYYKRIEKRGFLITYEGLELSKDLYFISGIDSKLLN